MIILIKLIFAHFLGDFLLQPKSWVLDKEEKKYKSPKLYWHIAIHLTIPTILLFNPDYWIGIAWIGISHLIIDLWKLFYQNKSNKRVFFFLDQFLHLLMIIMVANFYTPFINQLTEVTNVNKIIVLFLAILLISQVTSKIIEILISKWAPENEDQEEDSLTDAGSYIGTLERLFIFGFILIGNLQAIGFLLAAKSVFRFGDLKDSGDRKLTEYVLIGTLLSFGLAIIISLLYVNVVSQLN